MNTSKFTSSTPVEGVRSLEPEWLSQWVQPQHLTPEAFGRYREEYASGPMPLLRLQDFLRPDVAEKLHVLLAEEGEYKKLYGLYNPDEEVSEERWLDAEEGNRLYKFNGFCRVRPGVTSLNPLVYVRLHKALEDPRFIAFFEHLIGSPLGPLQSFGGSAFEVGDYLREHNDTGRNRHLAFIIYLNPNWQPEYGGALHVIGREGEEVVLEVEYNSLVVFDVHGHRHHYIAPIEQEAGEQRRLTAGGWIKRAGAEGEHADVAA